MWENVEKKRNANRIKEKNGNIDYKEKRKKEDRRIQETLMLILYKTYCGFSRERGGRGRRVRERERKQKKENNIE